MVHESKKPPELGFMVHDLFSRPLFSYGSAFWVYRGSVSVEQRHCLCGTDTVSVWDTHNVSVWDTHSPGGQAGGAGEVHGKLQPHTGASQSPHTHPKLLSRSCGGNIVKWSQSNPGPKGPGKLKKTAPETPREQGAPRSMRQCKAGPGPQRLPGRSRLLWGSGGWRPRQKLDV